MISLREVVVEYLVERVEPLESDISNFEGVLIDITRWCHVCFVDKLLAQHVLLGIVLVIAKNRHESYLCCDDLGSDEHGSVLHTADWGVNLLITKIIGKISHKQGCHCPGVLDYLRDVRKNIVNCALCLFVQFSPISKYQYIKLLCRVFFRHPHLNSLSPNLLSCGCHSHSSVFSFINITLELEF